MSTVVTTVIDTIKDLYTKETYYQKYGKDVFISIFIIYLFMTAAYYFHVLNHIPNIRANWAKNRCNPIYMPFAGAVLNDPKKTNLTQIEENFSQCVQNILISIINAIIEPIIFAITIIIDSIGGTIGTFSTLRNLFNAIRSQFSGVTNNIENKLMYSNAPLIRLNATIKDSMHKAIGILATSLYELFGVYFTLKAFGGSIIQIIYQLILIPLAITIASLMASVFGIIMVPPLVLLYIAIQIPVLIIQYALVNILKIQKLKIEGI